MTTITQGENFVFRIELNDVEIVGDPLTSGTIVVGLIYRISAYVTGDDFLNVGASANANTIEFTATGTTPTVWTHSSSLQQITKIPIAAADIADCAITARQGRATLKAWDKTSAQMLITDGLVRLEVLKSVTANWLGDVEFTVSPSFLEPDYFSSGAQTDVACFNDLLTVTTC